MSDYSKTPLAKKLGLKKGFKILTIGEPTYYFDLFPDFPEDVEFIDEPETDSLDFIHLFVTTYANLHEEVNRLKPFIKKTGMIWISWPKTGSSVPGNLKRDPLREFVLKQGLVDVKVASINEDWGSIKFMYRVKDR